MDSLGDQPLITQKHSIRAVAPTRARSRLLQLAWLRFQTELSWKLTLRNRSFHSSNDRGARQLADVSLRFRSVVLVVISIVDHSNIPWSRPNCAERKDTTIATVQVPPAEGKYTTSNALAFVRPVTRRARFRILLLAQLGRL